MKKSERAGHCGRTNIIQRSSRGGPGGRPLCLSRKLVQYGCGNESGTAAFDR